MAIHGTLSVVLAFVLTGLSTLIVALRFYSRHFLVGKVTASDWVMLLALITAWASVVVNWYLIHFLDYRSVHSRETLLPIATGALKTIWVYRINYILDLCLIKTSILLFYNYIASSRKSFHYIVRVLLTIILVGSASMIIASVFSCYPISDAWSLTVLEQTMAGNWAMQCYNPTPFWFFNATYNLVTDILIWTLPIIFFLNLKTMKLRRRLELISIFSIGIMAIVGSAIRLRVIILWLSDFQHQGENQANLMIWSQVEQNVGIIAGSIPFLRPIFRKALLKVRNREQPSPSPAVCLIDNGNPDRNVMPRTPIIPSPSPTFDGSREFRRPGSDLPPIEQVESQSSWGSGIWDGSQAQRTVTR
ncbi:hypothetical protein CC86DRAFT_380355 [Ophiobolus disseminans]|uniref:Rhodopsin domain-containing protein n=1 Tax=Ophiobolus disseminans TaxID=1469910 RepID=A0A6A7A736_9PLEO|nr:hypothetical protein CC86DRAFT_380355 [Ophiobolus disseminans]